jgi:cytochrome c oxidase subunit 2
LARANAWGHAGRGEDGKGLMLSWLPENVSTYGPEIDRLFTVIYYVTGATFFAVQITLLVFLFLYRHRDGRRATYTHGNTALEIAWTIAPAVLLVILAFVSRSTWAEIKGRVPPSDVLLQVTAKQFNWEIAYPGPDGKLGTPDDVTMDNDVHVPVNKTIRLVLKSRDVIHSFFVPSLRFKQDMVPGHEIPAWFKVTKAGKYEIPCAELCGFGHSGMRGWLYVHAQDEYDAWARENRIGPSGPAGTS